MIDDTPLTRPGDRFPIGLPGHVVPVSAAAATAGRPWGMDYAVIPVAVELPQLGAHEKPAKTYTRADPTEYNEDGRVKSDSKTVTVTD
jgi:hypothetical protein